MRGSKRHKSANAHGGIGPGPQNFPNDQTTHAMGDDIYGCSAIRGTVANNFICNSSCMILNVNAGSFVVECI